MDAVLYVHGMGGSAAEAEHYRELFPGMYTRGLDYRGGYPWDAGKEIYDAVRELSERYGKVYLIANSIGAFFTLHSGADSMIEKAWFISPLIDMEAMILGLLAMTGADEDLLREKGTLPGPFGDDLSWEYLTYVREHPVSWNVPTQILCGSLDDTVPFETVNRFAEMTGAGITVMEGGEHWFHTPEAMDFLDRWIKGPAAV